MAEPSHLTVIPLLNVDSTYKYIYSYFLDVLFVTVKKNFETEYCERCIFTVNDNVDKSLRMPYILSII